MCLPCVPVYLSLKWIHNSLRYRLFIAYIFFKPDKSKFGELGPNLENRHGLGGSMLFLKPNNRTCMSCLQKLKVRRFGIKHRICTLKESQI